MLPNWLYGKSRSKLAELLGGGGTPSDYAEVKAQVTQNAEDILSLSDTLDTKAALTQISNPNLLDNPWFTVNQRGKSSYTASGYTVDRWMVYSSDTTKSVAVSNGITFDSGFNGNFYQKLGDAMIATMLGKAVTLSVLLSDGSVISSNITLPDATPSEAGAFGNKDISGHWYVRMYFTGAYWRFEIHTWGVEATDTVSIRAVKLEVGEVSTLAMDTVPDYTIELIKCKHYFQVFTGDLGRAVTLLANRIQFNVPLSVRLYSAPTVTATPRIFNLDTTEETGFTFSYSAINNLQTLRINADKTAHGLTDAYVNAGTEKLYISAEL